MSKRYFAYYQSGSDLIVACGLWLWPDDNPDPPPMGDRIGIEITEADHDTIRAAQRNNDRIRMDGANFIVEAKPEVPAVIDKTTITGDGVDAATISSIPGSTSVAVCILNSNGAWESYQTFTVDDGIFQFSVNDIGEYKIQVAKMNYRTKEFVINAV